MSISSLEHSFLTSPVQTNNFILPRVNPVCKNMSYSSNIFKLSETPENIHFVDGLNFRWKKLCFSSDDVSGRLMKTEISFESGGKVTLTTRNKGRGAEKWLTHLLGKKHIRPVT